MTSDVRDFDDLKGGCAKGTVSVTDINFDDCISSVQVAPGWTVTLYEDPGFRGPSLTITSDIPDLQTLPGPCDQDFDDCASSMRVRRR